MRRIIASVCLWWTLACAASSTSPLAFGMTKDEAAAALGAPLAYVAGGRGSETYIALRNGNVPGVDPVDKAVALQFRRGRLTGWKKDWRLRQFWP
jgi:hypothetical protein